MSPRGVLFVTGASGFVGQRVLARASERFARVIALSRGALAEAPSGVERVRGDLLDAAPAAWEAALAGCDAVLHLAATTGKASPAEVERGVVVATQRLLAAAQRAGVRHFVFVSTIAVRFPDQRHYPYAHAKAAAERAVGASGLPATIVRPAIVAGPGSPVLAGFATLARAPVTPSFGSGQTRVAPIHVEDLAEALVEIAAGEPSAEPIELGGPESFTLDALFARLRAAEGGGAPRLVHLPLAPVRELLAALEPVLRPLLPLTAGQLATFANDGLPAPSAFAASRRGALRPIFAAASMAPRGDSDESLRAECARLVAHLLGRETWPELEADYLRQQRELGLDAPHGFDALLVRLARRGGLALALADAYAGWFARRSVLRTKLVGVLALLETSPRSFAAIDAPSASAPFARLALRGLAELASALVAALLLGPLHLLLGRR